MSDHDQNPNPPTPCEPDPSETDETSQARQELLAYARDIDEVVTRHVTKEAVAARLDRVLRRAREDAQSGPQPGPQGAPSPLQDDGPGGDEPPPAGGGYSPPTSDTAGGTTLHDLASVLVALLLRSLNQAQHTAQEFEDAALRKAAAITRQARERAEAITARAEEKERTAQHVLQEAHQQSAQIIADAQHQAARIVDEAHSQAGACRSSEHLVNRLVPSNYHQEATASLRTVLQSPLSHLCSYVSLAAKRENGRSDARQKPLTSLFDDYLNNTVVHQGMSAALAPYLDSAVAVPAALPGAPRRRRLEKVRDHLKKVLLMPSSVFARGSWSSSTSIAPVKDNVDIMVPPLDQEPQDSATTVVCIYLQYPSIPWQAPAEERERADFFFVYPPDVLLVCDYTQGDDSHGSHDLHLDVETL